MPPPSYDGVYKENWEAGCQESQQLALVLSSEGHVKRGGVSKSSTSPRASDACTKYSMQVKEGQENTQSVMLTGPQQTEACLLKCVLARMLKPATGNTNSVPLRSEAIKDFPLMGWLVDLDYMNFLACSLDLKAT